MSKNWPLSELMHCIGSQCGNAAQCSSARVRCKCGRTPDLQLQKILIDNNGKDWTTVSWGGQNLTPNTNGAPKEDAAKALENHFHYLLRAGDIMDWQAGDLCEDGMPEAFDLGAMKKMFLA